MTRVRVLLAVCAVLLGAYALRVLPGDAPDEPAHAEYAAGLADRGALPTWDWPARPNSYEAFQPPLYYAGAAVLLNAGRSLPLSARFFAMRFFSAALTLASLAMIAALGRRLDGRDGFAAACAAAVVPMFYFDGATVTNDAAANLAGVLLLWRACGSTRTRRDALELGAAAGAALLCKTTVLPVVGVALLALLDRDARKRAASLERILVAGAAALLVCGWFYARNWSRYGDPFGLSRIGAYDRDRFAWSEFPRWAALFFESFWGRFGSMTRPLPGWAYGVCAAALAASALGWAKARRALAARPGRALLGAASALTLAQNFWYGFFRAYQPQARYSFPALAAFAVLFADGLGVWAARWSPADKRRAAWTAAVAAVAVHAAAFAVLR